MGFQVKKPVFNKSKNSRFKSGYTNHHTKTIFLRKKKEVLLLELKEICTKWYIKEKKIKEVI
jgi:hypothetical protein